MLEMNYEMTHDKDHIDRNEARKKYGLFLRPRV